MKTLHACLMAAVVGLGLSAPAADVTIRVQTRMEPPRWALLERRLLAANVPAATEFFEKYYDRRGYLKAYVRWGANDGPDDAFEHFNRWPELHALGASDEILRLYTKGHEGLLQQYTEARTTEVPIARQGMYAKEFIVQSDWMHHGEGLQLFNRMGMSIPQDTDYQTRARRFAGFYMAEDPDAPNYDPALKIIRSMQNGSRGPMLRKATALDWVGDPFDVAKFDAEHGESTFKQFLQHYEEYTDVAGDHFLNLAATTLHTNAYLLTGDQKYKRWVIDYMDAWLTRMRDNGGIIPSHIGLDGTIGGPEKKWWAGAYGWGFSPINPVTGRREDRNRIGWALPGFGNALLLTGDQKYVDAWRAMTASVNSHARGEGAAKQFPTMYGPDGWYGWRSAPWDVGAVDLWYWSQKPEDLPRVAAPRSLPTGSGAYTSLGTASWISFLRGEKSAYPEEALQWDLDLIEKRLAAMRKDAAPPDRRLADNMLDYNPVAAESLVQLMWGALMPGRNGGLVNARLRYFDPDRQRAGVPEDVAALVSEMSDTQTKVTLVNLNPSETRRVVVQGGAYAEHQIESVGLRGTTTPVQGSHFTVQLDPGCGDTLVLTMKRYANAPTARHPWQRTAPVASGDDLHVMVSGGFTAAYKVLVAEWERSTGRKVTTVNGASMGGAPTSIPSRLSRGEPADVVILARTALDALAKDGKVVSGSQVDLANSRIGMAVKAGASKPAIDTVEQFRRVLLDARSIGYSESASGVYISTEMFKKLGIADQVAARAKMISGRPVADAVAKGEVEIGFQQISEILPIDGISFVGPIPDAVQLTTTFSAGIAAASKSSATARQLIEHLASAEARETIRQTGLDPVKTPHQIAFTRVFPNAGQIGLFIAAADGSGERQLFDAAGFDYDATWSPDGTTIIFTSDREGSPDLFRIRPDGTGRERLTDDPAYDDQAAVSPDGTQVAFVSTRNGGYARIWTMDLRSRQVKAVTTTTSATGMGGDFRPAWSPDGRWIAFSSDRGMTMAMARGRWEALQPADIYIVRPDGTGVKRVNAPGNFCGSPKFSADGARLLAYCMPLESTLETRRPSPLPGNDTTLVSINIATGKVTDIPAGPGVKISPAFLRGGDIGYVRKDSSDAGIYYTSGKRGPRGNVRVAAWSPDGSRVVFHRRQVAPPTSWLKYFSRHPDYDLAFTSVLPSFNPSGDRFVQVGRPEGPNALGSSIQIVTPGTNAATTIYKDDTRNVLGPQWSPTGDRILFGVGTYQTFFNGFVNRIMSHDQRVEGGAQLAIINPDGSGFREITRGANNNGFPSMSPDGKRIVYRTFGPDGEGLRIMHIDTGAVTTLTSGYDNFPIWSPRGDRIVFSRVADGDYEIYTIAPDGSGEKRLTTAIGNDAHQGWSPDGAHIVFASSRMGFKDEGAYTDAPQPYGELFVMRADGTGLEQLTDNQWEEGTPAWRPRR